MLLREKRLSTLREMKFLLDENVTHKALNLISDMGYQVSSVKKEKLLGTKNGDLSPIIKENDWVIITHDKGFRSHCVKYGLKVILVDTHPITEKFVLPVLQLFFKEFSGKLKDTFLISVKDNAYTVINY